MKSVILNIILSMLIILPQSCEKLYYTDSEVDMNISKEMEEKAIPSVVACVVDSNDIRWTGTFGYANTEYAIPATEETIYPLESISKLFIAITVFQLWEQGLINLEEDINSYLPFEVRNPNFPDSPITPYMLLNHTSSLAWPTEDDDIPDFHHFYKLDEAPPLIRDWLPEYILPGGESYRDVVWKSFTPGEMYLYSNIGASLLALVVEEISGMDYRDYCRTNIFDPLEMESTSFYFSELDYEHIATPYNDENNPMWYFTCRHYPSGFINTNLIDFANFAKACLRYGELNGKRILNEETFRKMLELQIPQAGVSYLWDHYIGDAVGHIGGGTGFSTLAEWNHNNGTAFFILSNKHNTSVYHKGRLYELVKYRCLHPLS
jgi:CubicO group peptidase (beta-lactamase class C family)